MTAPSSIDPARFLHDQLESASPDLLRSMLATFINTLMSAEADAVCGAPYGMPGPERVNVRNGYRHRGFDTRAGTLGLKPSDAGVGSATLNTSQQVGGSVGTALLNTLAAGAVTTYLAGRAITPANLQTAALHSYTTAFLYSALIFVVAAIVAGLVLPRGNMRTLSGLAADGTGADPVAGGRV